MPALLRSHSHSPIISPRSSTSSREFSPNTAATGCVLGRNPLQRRSPRRRSPQRCVPRRPHLCRRGDHRIRFDNVPSRSTSAGHARQYRPLAGDLPGGVIIPPVQFLREGEICDDVFKLILNNVRSPRETGGRPPSPGCGCEHSHPSAGLRWLRSTAWERSSTR